MSPMLLVILAIVLAVVALLPFIHRAYTQRRPTLPGEPHVGRERPSLVETRPSDLRDSDRADVEAELPAQSPDERQPPPSFLERLGKARSVVSGYVGSVLSRSSIDASTWDELEEALVRADVGVGTATGLIEALRERAETESISEPVALIAAFKADLKADLEADRSLSMAPEGQTVWLFVGVNGVGKTTTIGKVGRRLTDQGTSVLMAAGDTFRAAAAEQLGTWAERCKAELVRGAEGADPSSVIFDGIQKADARGIDVVLGDTAGRLHNKVNLMEELRKVRRVADREPGFVSETLLVIDATTGQNGLAQAKVFAEAVDVTGVVLTKLDGSAKGGIVFAVQHELGIPVKLVGLGEGADDLVDFDADEFVEALLAHDG
jgi:fused signal recognition particle receptor